MAGYESAFLAGGMATGVLPVEPALAAWILVGVLVLAAAGVLLAAVPPSGLLRRVDEFENRRTPRRTHAPASV